LEQPIKVANTDTQPFGEGRDVHPIKLSFLNQAERSSNRSSGTHPRWTEGGGFWTAAVAGTIACCFRCGSRWQKEDVLCKRRLYSANWAAVDLCCSNSNKEESVVSRIVAKPSLIAGHKVEHN